MHSIKLSLTLIIFFLAHASFATMEVHEWGTFTSLVGSNGMSQDGMHHEDEALPPFVHGFGETGVAKTPLVGIQCRRGKGCVPAAFLDNNIITQKMETPVIYFYTNEQQKVEVEVSFPEGVITETYPAPRTTFPTAESPPVLANGKTTFSVQVLPALIGDLPFVEPGNIYAHARKVKSNIVESGMEREKFIFYRGLGRFQPRIAITSHDGNLLLTAAESVNKPKGAFLVHVNNLGQAKMLNLGSFSSASITAQQLAELKNHETPPISSRLELIQELSNAGLFSDEAHAMVNTWENGYFKVPGLRLLYILPSPEVDQILPLNIKPAPKKLVRVFVARVEILLDTDEASMRTEIERTRLEFNVTSLGRFAEPILRRVAESYLGTDQVLRDVYRSLINRASLESSRGSLSP